MLMPLAEPARPNLIAGDRERVGQLVCTGCKPILFHHRQRAIHDTANFLIGQPKHVTRNRRTVTLDKVKESS